MIDISNTISIGSRDKGINWSSYWATLISATVETAAPTHVVLTFPTAQTSLGASDFTIAGFTISSASWAGAVLTLVLSTEVIQYNGNLTISFVKTGTTVVVTNNVNDGETVGWFMVGDGSATYLTKDGSDRVSQLNDLSGGGHHLLQATDNNKPVYSSSTGLYFQDATDVLKSANFTLNQPESVYLVLKRRTTAVTEYFSDGRTQYYGCILAGANSQTLYANAGTMLSSTTIETNRYKVVKCQFNGVSSKLQVNKYTAKTGNAGSANMGGIQLGAAVMDVKEAIYRKVADDAPMDELITDYLINKYDIDNQNIIGIIGDSITGDYTPVGLAVRKYIPHADIRTYNDCAITGDTPQGQQTKFLALRDKEQCRVVFVFIGHNSLNDANLMTNYQTLINAIRTATSASCKIILNTLLPSTSWSGAARWTTLNEAIRGGGATPITGADGYIDVANSTLNNGSNGLVPIYSENGDDSGHENAAGRQVIAALWDAKLDELGY